MLLKLTPISVSSVTPNLHLSRVSDRFQSQFTFPKDKPGTDNKRTHRISVTLAFDINVTFCASFELNGNCKYQNSKLLIRILYNSGSQPFLFFQVPVNKIF